MDLLLSGFHAEYFLEGYARVFLEFSNLLTLMWKPDKVHVTNVNQGGISVNLVISSLYAYLSKRVNTVIEVYDIMYPSDELIGAVLRGLRKAEVVVLSWKPHPLFSIILSRVSNKISGYNSKLILFTYSLNYLEKVLKSLRLKDESSEVVILNPCCDIDRGSLKLIKVLPPVHSIFLQKGSKVLRERSVDKGHVTFRFMGRFQRGRGIKEVITAFKRFRIKRPEARAKLIIDSFSEDIETEGVFKLYGGDVHIVIANPIKRVKEGASSPRQVIEEIAYKYAYSSYVVLPYTRPVHITPSLTLLEALGAGGFVIATKNAASVLHRDVKKCTFIVDTQNVVEELVKAFEYLYEEYDSNFYWRIRDDAHKYAHNNFSYEKTIWALKAKLT